VIKIASERVVLSVQGIEYILLLWEQGKDLPESWERDINRYLENKLYSLENIDSSEPNKNQYRWAQEAYKKIKRYENGRK